MKLKLLQILLPVHNEVGSIEKVIKEIYDEISPKIDMEFIISEDGSTDQTPNILQRLSKKIPIKLVSDPQRKGYSRAVIDGMKEFNGKYLLCLDSDGQCDPKDFWKFWKNKDNSDLLIGNRIVRKDTPIRKCLSKIFYYYFKIIFPVKIKDPSCPFLLTTPKVINKLLPELGTTDQGFWWEFVARTFRRNFSITEISVNHRLRFAGKTQVYKFKKMPGIGYHHALALLKIWRETKN